MGLEAGTYRYTMALVLVILALISLGLLFITTILALQKKPQADAIASPKPPSPAQQHARVQADYLRAMAWLSKGIVLDIATQRAEASAYLCGDYLQQHRQHLQNIVQKPPLIGVLRCIHTLNIQPIEGDDKHYLVIDSQYTRRMVTYCTSTYRRVATQDLGDSAVVYEMCYDSIGERWKLSRFIQELPHGWNSLKRTYPIKLVVENIPDNSIHDN